MTKAWSLCLGVLLGVARVSSAQTPTIDQLYDGLLQSIVPRSIIASTPVPGSTGVPTTVDLTWGGLWLETSTVYLSVCSVTTAPPAVATNVVGTRWTSPTPLQANTQYCWRVVGRNRAGASTNTTVWRFTTAAGSIPPPTISCPANQTVAASAATGIAVAYPAAVVTGGAPPVTVTAGPVSGSVFPVGATAVTMVATDAQARSASCSFSITVTFTPPPPPPVLTVSLSAPQTTVTCSPTIGPTLRLTATVTGATPQRVDFLRDGAVMQAVTAAPYIMDWQLYCGWTPGGPPPGRSTTLTARRVDASGSIDSAPLAMLVIDGGLPPPPPPTFSFSVGWDPNAPTDQVLDYQLVVDSAAPVVVPPVLDATCACVKPPPITVLAGVHMLSVRARNVVGLSQPAVLTVTRP